MTSLEQTLLKIAQFLETKKIPYMVIGGVANLFWGLSRTTLDVDVTVNINEKKIGWMITEITRHFRLRVTDPEKFVAETKVLPLEDTNGIRVDLVLAILPYEQKAIARARQEQISNQRVRICSPEDLILYKIISDRLKDQEDVRGIVQQLGLTLDRKYLDPLIRELAQALSKPGLWTFYLDCFGEK